MKIVWPSALMLGMLAASPICATGQWYGGAEALTGIEHIGLAGVFVTWDDRISQKTEEQFEREVRDAFELGVRRFGIVIDEAREPIGRSVWCTVVMIYDNGLVSYSQEVDYREFLMRAQPRSLREAKLWGTTSVVTVGAARLDGAHAGEDCAESFELAWRRSNPE